MSPLPGCNIGNFTEQYLNLDSFDKYLPGTNAWCWMRAVADRVCEIWGYWMSHFVQLEADEAHLHVEEDELLPVGVFLGDANEARDVDARAEQLQVLHQLRWLVLGV